MDKKWLRWLAAPAAALMLAACGNGEEAAEKPVDEQKQETEQSSEQAGFPVTMTDATGNEITLEKEPDAIVSMIPSNTEILFAVGAGDAVVGVGDFDDYPEEAQEIEKIGGLEFNVEKILSLDPDLVLAHDSAMGTHEAGLQQLRDAGLNVFVIEEAQDFETAYETIGQVGELTGNAEEAAGVVEEMKNKVDEVISATEGMEPKTVFAETSPAPEIYTPGGGTFTDEMLGMIGAENMAGDQEGWIMMDPEEVISRNPDVILVMYSYLEGAVDGVKAREGYSTVNAVKNDEVVQVDENITSRPGPRLAEGLEAIAKAVYPEAFEGGNE